MHRKRSSLEQGLVTPSPLPSRQTFDSQPSNETIVFPASDGCLSRVPLSSLNAFLFCIFGVILFTTMMVWAFNATIEQLRRALYINNLPWLDKVQLLFIITALAMSIVALAFLCIGILSTGPTRASIFYREQARRGGRISCIVTICLAATLNLLWTIILAFVAILCFVYTIFSALCSSVNPSSANGGGSACLNFSLFRPLVQQYSDATLEFCDGQLQQFCALTNTVLVWYFVGLLGASIVCLGLVQFVATSAANYAHVGNEARQQELRSILYAEINGCGGSGTGIYPMDHWTTTDNKPHLYHQQQKQVVPVKNNSSRRKWWYEEQHPAASGHDPALVYYSAHQQPLEPTADNNNIHFSNGGGGSNQYDRRKRRDPSWAAAADMFVKNNKREQQQSWGVQPRKSVGAVLDSHRRNSYQTSLHGSNNWLNQQQQATTMY